MCDNLSQPQQPHSTTIYEQMIKRMFWIVLGAIIGWPIIAIIGIVTTSIIVLMILQIQNPLTLVALGALGTFSSTVEGILFWTFRHLFSLLPMDEKRFLVELEKAKSQKYFRRQIPDNKNNNDH